MERIISEIFDFKSKKIKVIKQDAFSCNNCIFNKSNRCVNQKLSCVPEERKDNKSVIYENINL